MCEPHPNSEPLEVGSRCGFFSKAYRWLYVVTLENHYSSVYARNLEITPTPPFPHPLPSANTSLKTIWFRNLSTFSPKYCCPQSRSPSSLTWINATVSSWPSSFLVHLWAIPLTNGFCPCCSCYFRLFSFTFHLAYLSFKFQFKKYFSFSENLSKSLN